MDIGVRISPYCHNMQFAWQVGSADAARSLFVIDRLIITVQLDEPLVVYEDRQHFVFLVVYILDLNMILDVDIG
jgi:hypothetical protein